jgi:hypothetical protein
MASWTTTLGAKDDNLKLTLSGVDVEKLLAQSSQNKVTSGCVIGDLLRSQDIFYPLNFGRLGQKASFSTPTPHIKPVYGLAEC